MPTDDVSNAQPSEEPSRESDVAAAPDAREEAPRRPPTRREILDAHTAQRRRGRPFAIGGLILLLALLAIPTVAYVSRYVLPPRQLAVRVEDQVYTWGDVVNYIRFNQRLSEELGVQYQVGTSLFEAEQVLWQNEVAFRTAPKLGVSVGAEEVDEEIRALLGFPRLTPEELQDAETRSNIEEAKRQFLNNVGLSGAAYRDIVKKTLFRRGVRERLAQDVPLIQPQVHLHEIVLRQPDDTITRQIIRRIAKGEPIGDIAVEVSIDPEVKRTRGDAGWFPENVIPEPRIERLLYGKDQNGNRLLPIGELSELIPDNESGFYNVYFISEYSEARAVDAEAFETLKDNAFNSYVIEEGKHIDSERVLNSEMYAWVSTQVKVASLLPTPTPSSGLLGTGGR